MGLTRKKVTVRTKKGKTFQRSVMVRAEAIGKRVGGKKLNSLNPWEARHTELVKGDFPKSQGSSGPGSDHSWMALIIANNMQSHRKAFVAADLPERDLWGAEHARLRRRAGEAEATGIGRYHRSSASSALNPEVYKATAAGLSRDNLIARHGRENVHEVYQDPRKHVR